VCVTGADLEISRTELVGTVHRVTYPEVDAIVQFGRHAK